MRIKQGIYLEKIKPKEKRKIIGELRSEAALMLEKSDKEEEQAMRDILWLRRYRPARG